MCKGTYEISHNESAEENKTIWHSLKTTGRSWEWQSNASSLEQIRRLTDCIPFTIHWTFSQIWQQIYMCYGRISVPIQWLNT